MLIYEPLRSSNYVIDNYRLICYDNTSRLTDMRNLMTIMISNLTVSSKAAANAVVGALTLYDANGTVRGTNFTLDMDAAGFFGISGNNLVALRASVPVGFYEVHVCGNAEYVAQTDDAYFVITVTAT
jgi:hypothetical protein